MRNFLIGLLCGLVIAAIAGYLLLPQVKQPSYEAGYAAGNSKGESAGMAAGIAKGVAQVQQEQKRVKDSIAVADKRQEDARRRMATARKKKEVVKVVQNWHVIDRKIADPIAN